MARRTYKNIFLISLASLFFFASCKRKSTIDGVLYKETKNKIYKEIKEEKLSLVIKETLEKENKQLKRVAFINNYYKNNGYKADLLINHFGKEKLSVLSEHLKKSMEHGIRPETFKWEKYQELLSTVYSKDKVNSLEEAYKNVALLEVATAEALLSYTSALEYGALNPNKILKRYYIETKEADSAFAERILKDDDVKNLLDSIQPSSGYYVEMQKALDLKNNAGGAGITDKSKTLIVNMERARWKPEIDTAEMIYVNIPAFQLDVIKGGKSVKNMKVVVGKGRNSAGKATFSADGKKVEDSPHSHETPILTSRIHSVQVNPVWNIPESIARKEILKLVQNDRFYLDNAGIDVLENGKVVEDVYGIDWSSLSADNLPYRFRQRPGDSNSLGKIKFLFENSSSVYLHDTPAKAGFDQDVRTASHGCVRVQEPMDLAEALFGKGDKFTTIQTNMESTTAKNAKDIALSPKTQIVLDYKTVVLKNKELQFYKDVYGQDIVIYSYL